MKHLPLALNEDQYHELKENAKHCGCSMASIVRIALTQYLDRAGLQ